MLWNCKHIFLPLLAAVALHTGDAAGRCIVPEDTLRELTEAPRCSGHAYRTVRRAGFRKAITPRSIVVQYAGGIGLVSAGAGWAYGGNDSWETDLMLGYVPPYSTGRGKLTVTARETYAPFELKPFGNLRFRPVAVGIYLNIITGHEFWMSEPTRYPKKYYGFSSGIRSGLSVGQRLHLRLSAENRRRYSDVMVYYDFNACDLDISAFATNGSVSLWDIVNISFGVKIGLFRTGRDKQDKGAQ